MRLDKLAPSGRAPLRTVTEIAEILGISTRQLSWALQEPDAPKASLRASEAGHCVTGNNKVWYEPREVVRWYRARPPKPADVEKRRKYHRDYYHEHYSAQAKLKEKSE